MRSAAMTCCPQNATWDRFPATYPSATLPRECGCEGKSMYRAKTQPKWKMRYGRVGVALPRAASAATMNKECPSRGDTPMRAFEVQNTFGIDSLTLAERPQPSPGPGQVLLKMRA